MTLVDDPMSTDPKVPIHIKTGCGISGSTELHTHPYVEWKAALDAVSLARKLDQVQGLAYAHRWDTTGGAHVLAARILNVLDGGR